MTEAAKTILHSLVSATPHRQWLYMDILLFSPYPPYFYFVPVSSNWISSILKFHLSVQLHHPPMQSVLLSSGVPPLQGSPGAPLPANTTIFEEALRDFKKGLSKKELGYFESVDLQDVEHTIKKIEFDQKQRKKMQNLARIKPFLDTMKQYGKIIEVFLNNSDIIAYIWVSIICQISSCMWC